MSLEKTRNHAKKFGPFETFVPATGTVIARTGHQPSSDFAAPGRTRRNHLRRGKMIGILIAIVLAALAYWVCVALGLPAIVALIAAVLVLFAGVPTGGYGFGSRFGRRY
jgi:hypothetical protein